MGQVHSAPTDGDALYLRDQTRCTLSTKPSLSPHLLTTTIPVSVAALNITTARGRSLLHITPNAFPATRYTAKRELGDDSVIDYVQVNSPPSPLPSSSAPPSLSC
jgi:Arf-GAP/SH3 domain/ANK repeat/PH domain-containing protein